MSTLWLCGAGNAEGVRLAQMVNAAGHRWDRLVVLDDDPRRLGHTLCDVPVIGPFGLLAEADPTTDQTVNLIARTTTRRAAAAARIAAFGIPPATLVHPDVDHAYAELGADVLVYQHAVTSPETRVGAGSVVFLRAIVGHEAQVGRGCVLAPGAVLNARVVLGDRAYVGANATILPEVTIGEGATIGGNTLVTADVPPGATVIGVPGVVLAPADQGAAIATPATWSFEQGRLEQEIAAAWQTVLGEHPEPTVAFFDLGGTSLLALRVLDLLQARHGLTVAVPDFYRFPTVRALAAHLACPPDKVGAAAGAARARFRRAHLR